MIDGVMYVTTAWSKVFALDAATGRELWALRSEGAGRAGRSMPAATSSTAASRPGTASLYLGTLDGRLVALDAATGKPVWEVMTVEPWRALHDHRRAARRQGQGDHRQRRRRDGRARLRHRVRRRDRQAAVALLHGARRSVEAVRERRRSSARRRPGPASGGSSAAAARSGTRSPTIPSSTCCTSASATARRGIARCAARAAATTCSCRRSSRCGPTPASTSGTTRRRPARRWDFTATQHMILADLTIGRPRAQGAHAGAEERLLLRARSRDRRAAVARSRSRPINWASGVDMKTGRPDREPRGALWRDRPAVRRRPGPGGAHSWQPMCYSPRTRLVYLPVMDMPFPYIPDAKFDAAQLAWNTGVDFDAGSLPQDEAVKAQIKASLKGHLAAWDPVAQREVWRVQYDHPWNGGVLSTAGDLVFQGDAMGDFAAFDAGPARSCGPSQPAPGSSRRPSPTRPAASSTWRSKSAGAAHLGWPPASSRATRTSPPMRRAFSRSSSTGPAAMPALGSAAEAQARSAA